jgi:hypothetical protein
MMGKKLRNLALLGGLGAAAYMMGSKKGESKTESKEDRERDAREKFISRSSKTTESKEDTERDAREKAVSGAVKPRKADAEPAAVTKSKTPTREEGRTASGLPREARGVGPGRPKDVSTAGAIQAANQGIPPTPAGSTNIPTTRSPTSRAGAKGRDPSRYGKPVTLDELFKKGGSVKSSASKRADGIAVKGKTRGRMV